MELTTNDVDDGAQVGPLLDQIDGPVASVTADGAFDRDDVYTHLIHDGSGLTPKSDINQRLSQGGGMYSCVRPRPVL